MYNYCTPLVIVVVVLKKLLHTNVSGWPCEQPVSKKDSVLTSKAGRCGSLIDRS